MHGFDTSILYSKYRVPIIVLLAGLLLILIGVFIVRGGLMQSDTKIEVLTDTDEGVYITAEISGEVLTPGVYNLKSGSRINDLLVAAGGFSANADRVWTDKYLNRALVVNDGQKIYIPSINQQLLGSSANNPSGDQSISTTFLTDSNTKININTATLEELDGLQGIGRVYGQNIIDQRPYSSIEELLSKGVLKKNTYEKIKAKLTVY